MQAISGKNFYAQQCARKREILLKEISFYNHLKKIFPPSFQQNKAEYLLYFLNGRL